MNKDRCNKMVECAICGREIDEDNACNFAVQLVDEGEVIKKEHEQTLCQSCAKAVAVAVVKALHDEPEN